MIAHFGSNCKLGFRFVGAMDGGSLVRKWQKLSEIPQTHHEKFEILQLSKGIVSYVRSLWQGLLGFLKSSESPALMSYMSDGFGCTTWTTRVSKLDGVEV